MISLWQKWIILIVVLLVGAVTGCGEAELEMTTPEPASADIQIQAEPPPTVTVSATATEQTLKTEIIEEPVSPISPVNTPDNTMTSASDAELPAGSEQAVEAAVNDLADRTGLSPDLITVVSVEATEWSDASLGCPQEGMMYAQVITPGFLIILEADGEQYEYHTNQTDGVMLCQE
jgi:hypothetical protein